MSRISQHHFCQRSFINLCNANVSNVAPKSLDTLSKEAEQRTVFLGFTFLNCCHMQDFSAAKAVYPDLGSVRYVTVNIILALLVKV